MALLRREMSGYWVNLLVLSATAVAREHGGRAQEKRDDFSWGDGGKKSGGRLGFRWGLAAVLVGASVLVAAPGIRGSSF